MITRNTMSSGLHLPIHRRRSNGHCTSWLLPRHCITWYILCSRTLPLCLIYRSSVCHYRGLCSLIPPILRVHTQPSMSKNSLCNYIRRSKYNILSTTLSRTIRNTSTILRLSWRIHSMKYYFLNRLIHLTNSSDINNLHYLRSICIKTISICSRTDKHKPRMTTRMSSSLSHIWRTNIYQPKISIRKEGIEPSPTGFKSTS